MIEKILNRIEGYYEHLRDLETYLKFIDNETDKKEFEKELMECESIIMELEHELKNLN